MLSNDLRLKKWLLHIIIRCSRAYKKRAICALKMATRKVSIMTLFIWCQLEREKFSWVIFVSTVLLLTPYVEQLLQYNRKQYSITQKFFLKNLYFFIKRRHGFGRRCWHGRWLKQSISKLYIYVFIFWSSSNYSTTSFSLSTNVIIHLISLE